MYTQQINRKLVDPFAGTPDREVNGYIRLAMASSSVGLCSVVYFTGNNPAFIDRLLKRPESYHLCMGIALTLLGIFENALMVSLKTNIYF